VLLLLAGLWTNAAAGAASVGDLWEGTYWGEPGSALLAHFGAGATVLQRPIDFGDSYAQIVLRRVMVGGIPLVAFMQEEKATGGLKRIQLERQRHGATPLAARAVIGAFEAAYGGPDALCGIAPGPASGYQAAAERVWRRDGIVIRAIFRDTTIEAFEGCLAGDPGGGPCGLTGQFLVRIRTPEADASECPLPGRAQ
jgi:hypothetical protein